MGFWRQFLGLSEPLEKRVKIEPKGGQQPVVNATPPKVQKEIPPPPPPDGPVRVEYAVTHKVPVPKLKFLLATVTSTDPYVEGELIAVGAKYKYGCVDTTLAWVEGSPEVQPNTDAWQDAEALIQVKLNLHKQKAEVALLTQVKDELRTEVTSLRDEVIELEKRRKKESLTFKAEAPSFIPKPTIDEVPRSGGRIPSNRPQVRRSSLEDEYGMGGLSVPAPETGVDMFDGELDANSASINEDDIAKTAAAFLAGEDPQQSILEQDGSSSGFVPTPGMRVIENDTDLAGVVQSIEDDVVVVLMEDRPEMQHIPIDGLRVG